jgi:hypothetical protein
LGVYCVALVVVVVAVVVVSDSRDMSEQGDKWENDNKTEQTKQ